MARHNTSRNSASFGSAIMAVGVNVLFMLGVIMASGESSEAMQQKNTTEATLEAENSEPFFCHYREGRKRIDVEVQARDTEHARELTCGTLEYASVVIPPLFTAGYVNLSAGSTLHSALLSQRENCSCAGVLLQEVKLIVPKLGQQEEKKRLPRHANRAEETVQNAVNKKVKPPKKKALKKKEPLKKIAKKAIQTLLPPSGKFDQYRPPNMDKESGVIGGSETGEGTIRKGGYASFIKGRLDKEMSIPKSISPSERRTLKGKIRLRINSKGYIIKWEWRGHRTSGHEAFDHMIESALKKFRLGEQYLPRPVPPEFQNQWINFTVDGTQMK